MKYLNGKLRLEQDSTLLLKVYPQKQKLNWMECFPLVVLAVLMSFLLVKYLVG